MESDGDALLRGVTPVDASQATCMRERRDEALVHHLAATNLNGPNALTALRAFCVEWEGVGEERSDVGNADPAGAA